jgi:hypothetical protein
MPRLIPLALAAALVAGCDTSKPRSTKKAADVHGHGHSHDDHDHDRGKMKLTHAGEFHVGLTARVGKDESDLEIVIEMGDENNPTPAPQPLKSFTATAKRAGDDKAYELTFEPGLKDGRKSDPDGHASRFEAKAPWMKPDDRLTVTARVEIAGKVRNVKWTDFTPKKYNARDEKK